MVRNALLRQSFTASFADVPAVTAHEYF